MKAGWGLTGGFAAVPWSAAGENVRDLVMGGKEALNLSRRLNRFMIRARRRVG
jgi:hypothetical protein